MGNGWEQGGGHHNGGPGGGPQQGGPGGGPGQQGDHEDCGHGGQGEVEDTEDFVQQSLQIWQSAYDEAYEEVHMDILKEKIRAAWGKRIEKAADLLIATKEQEWAAVLLAEKCEEGKGRSQEKFVDFIAQEFQKGPRS